MSPLHQYLHSIDTQRDDMIGTLRRWAEINSGTDNLPGLAAMSRELVAALQPLADEIREIDLTAAETIDSKGNSAPRPLGKAIIATRRPQAAPRVLLNIHYDTVYSPTDPFQRTKLLDDNTLNGPGVVDAKGGIVVLLAALRALEQSPVADRIGWEVIFNPDEEIGSPGSTALFAEAARRNHLALVFEPAFPDGALVSSRKGSGTFTAVVRGRDAHAGRDFDAGRNAIRAAAQLICALPAHPHPSIIINPGRIEGGGAVNIVPDLSIVRFNVRADTRDDQLFVERFICETAETVARQTDGITITLHGGFTSPPKPFDSRSARLMDLLLQCGRELGLSLTHRPSGGTCDGSKLAAAGLPVLDSLGPVGGHLHCPEEYVKLDSIPQRAKLTALLLLHLAQNGAPRELSSGSE